MITGFSFSDADPVDFAMDGFEEEVPESTVDTEEETSTDDVTEE